MIEPQRSIWLLLILCFCTSNCGVGPFWSTGNSQLPWNEMDFANPKTTDIPTGKYVDLEEELSSAKPKLDQKAIQNNKLDEESSGLRIEVRQLQLRLSTCSSMASAIAGSYQTQLQGKLNQLLELIDSETFQMLRIMALTREVHTLQKRLLLISKNTNSSTEMRALQRQLQDKAQMLATKRQQYEERFTGSDLILRVVSLQNEIWDAQQLKSNENDDTRTRALQDQIDRSIRELPAKYETVSLVLEMISVNSKINVIQKKIRSFSEERKSKHIGLLIQWKQKSELLAKKVSELTEDVENIELTKAILDLQNELSYLAKLLSTQETLENEITVLTGSLETERSRADVILKRLEMADNTTTQLISRIISIMEELNEQPLVAPTDETQDILTLLQSYKRDHAQAQTEIKDLKEKLERTQQESLGFTEKYDKVKTDIKMKIAELRKEDSTTALIMDIIYLPFDIKSLNAQISGSVSERETGNLMKKLLQKEEELIVKKADLQLLISNPEIVVAIVELQHEVWGLLSTYTNETSEDIEALLSKMKSLIRDLGADDKDNPKLLMKILTLGSQLEFKQNQVSHAEMSHNPSLNNQFKLELAATDSELKPEILKLIQKNHTTGNLILSIFDSHHKLHKLENEREREEKKTSSTISKLRKELECLKEENNSNQALIQTLQGKLNQRDTQCAAYDHKMKVLLNEIDLKLEELKSTSDDVTVVILQISLLSVQGELLKNHPRRSESEFKMEELKRLKDLESKAGELQQLSHEATRFLKIIGYQAIIGELAHAAANGSNSAKIRDLQEELTALLNEVDDDTYGNIKLVFQILSQQDEMLRLKWQQQQELDEIDKTIKDQKAELDHIKTQIGKKTRQLNANDMRIANISAEIVKLHRKIQPLEEKISTQRRLRAENLKEFMTALNRTQKELEDTKFLLNQTNSKNYQLIMDIIERRTQLRADPAYKSPDKDTKELEEKLQLQQNENGKLDNLNRNLKQQVAELQECCAVNTNCEDVQKDLQQSQEDADRLYQQLQEKDAALGRLQQDFEEQSRQKAKLQVEYDRLLNELSELDDETIFAPIMTLDPDTAHPRLALSEDKTQVYTLQYIAPVTDHPGRYDVALAVLGTTGISKGKHYWEVSVAGNTCYLVGMASESASRRGTLRLKPTHGFWTLVMTKRGQLVALDQSHVPIPVKVNPLTLGILLDYKKGAVSFYDASSRSHLYSFTDQRFTDKLHPLINYCVEEMANPIVLLPPGPTDWLKS